MINSSPIPLLKKMSEKIQSRTKPKVIHLEDFYGLSRIDAMQLAKAADLKAIFVEETHPEIKKAECVDKIVFRLDSQDDVEEAVFCQDPIKLN